MSKLAKKMIKQMMKGRCIKPLLKINRKEMTKKLKGKNASSKQF